MFPDWLDYRVGQLMKILQGHAIDLLDEIPQEIALLATDPPYAFGGSGGEHALSAAVATTLREYGKRVKNGWAVVFCASSWRSTAYMVEAMRGVMDPVRMGTWIKEGGTTKVKTPGWRWASVNVLIFRKGKPAVDMYAPSERRDWCGADPITNGRRAQLPDVVCEWAVNPYARPGYVCVDPFAGSGALLKAAEKAGMDAYGCEIAP